MKNKMGRLTKINEDACDLCKSWVLCKDKNCLSYEVYKKLAHYEDLEEQGRLIELDDSLPARDELDRCTRRNCNNCDKYKLELQLYKDNDKRIKEMIGMDMAEASARFASYMKMKDEGRLIELPCAVGDTAYFITVNAEGEYIIGSGKFSYSWLDYPRMIYATKEEAEKKLQELQGNE